METRVRLSKRRARAGVAAQALTRLVVTHRPLSAPEHRMLRLREKQLEPPQVRIIYINFRSLLLQNKLKKKNGQSNLQKSLILKILFLFLLTVSITASLFTY